MLNAIVEIIRVTDIIFSRESLYKKLYELEMEDDFDKRYLNRSLKRFETQGVLKRIKDKGRDYYKLTPAGLKKLSVFRLDRNFKSIIQKWDGYWRLVIFDIPEDQKTVREGLRSKLKSYGFYPLQKSVFVYPFSCEKEIEELAGLFDLGGNLDTLLVKSLGKKEKEVRQFFQAAL